MDLLNVFNESKSHGSADYPFGCYNVTSEIPRQFATNHWHEEVEILFVESGRISITINHNQYIGEPGDIFIVNSGEVHEIFGITAPLNYTALVFDFDMLSFRGDDYVQMNFLQPILSGEKKFLNSIQNPNDVFPLLQEIGQRNALKNAYYKLRTKLGLLQFLTHLIEQNQMIDTPEKHEKRESLKDIIAYINLNYANKISLAEVSARFHMSLKYFCRYFKKNFGKTFVEYLNEVRIENAARLLNSEDITVTDVAISCGFDNMSYFARVFRQKMGSTPSQYRKRTHQ